MPEVSEKLRAGQIRIHILKLAIYHSSESRVRVALVRVAAERSRVTYSPLRGELQVKPEPDSYPSPT